MQVLPRFISIDKDGNEHEFLSEYFSNPYEALSAVFLKGYQWPFDSKKVLDGSSVIDLLVYRECVLKKRRVYLDFTKNPFMLKEIEYNQLSNEAYEYLKNANSCFGKPIDRLIKMNTPAVELYAGKGVDITKEYLEIALCAQHNNGGIAVDMWWQTNVEGLFAAGECAGTHGVTRPGGSALNAGQIGSLRAAQYISESNHNQLDIEEFKKLANQSIVAQLAVIQKVLNNKDNTDILIKKAQRRMSDSAAAIRNQDVMQKALEQVKTEIDNLKDTAGVTHKNQLYKFYKLKDILIMQLSCLTAMIDYANTVGATRGSSLYYDKKGVLRKGFEELFRFTPRNGITDNKIQEVSYGKDGCIARWRDARPLPADDDFFENIWRSYRQNKNIY